LRIAAEFVTSAARTTDFPRDGLPEIALVGRSNAGKSSLINGLVLRRVARTSAAPGKTRLANVYRVLRGNDPWLYLVDLPGYGYARGGSEFEELTRSYFGRGARSEGDGLEPVSVSAWLVVDARHPGLASDRQAWAWLGQAVPDRAVVATKIDKLARGHRIRARDELESVFEESVTMVSSVTGEGLDELWKLIDRAASSRKPEPQRSRRHNNSSPLPKGMAPRPLKR